MSGILAGRRALVTGASKGMGAAIAEAFASAGADVAITARSTEGLEQTAATVRAQGRDCLLIAGDLGTEADVRKVAEAALAWSDGWDILVNNAGIGLTMPLLDMTVEAWDASMAVNLRAPLMLAQALVPKMITRGGGKIINISSSAAFVGAPTGGAYAASKAALNQLTRTMAVEWGPHNIQVNAICPTVVLTDMGRQFWLDPAHAVLRDQRLAKIPAHRFGEVKDVADLALFLAGPASNFISGVALPLDGGMLVAP